MELTQISGYGCRIAGRLVTVVAACATLLAACATGASAADRVYWANAGGADTIGVANLDGSGASTVPTPGAIVSTPRGLAIDVAAGRIYWLNDNNASIGYANFDGSLGGTIPTGSTNGSGLAVDPAAGVLYWADLTGDKIKATRIDGSGTTTVNTSGATVNAPAGVALDLAAGRIYFASITSKTISYARLDGSGGADVPTTGATVNVPEGVAIDPAAGRVYWPNQGGNAISYARLDGTGGADLATTGASMADPTGIAVDPSGGRFYWGNYLNDSLSFARLDGSGGGDIVPPSGGSSPIYPVILKAPQPGASPAVASTASPGAVLACPTGSWEPDLLGGHVYRSPRSFSYQWSRDGADIAGATDSSYTAFADGTYSCRVTATNPAGSATQTTVTFTVAAPADNTQQPPPPPVVQPSAFGAATLVSLKLAAARIPAKGPLRLIATNGNPFVVSVKLGVRTSKRVGKRQVSLRAATATLPASVKRKLSFALPKRVQAAFRHKRTMAFVIRGTATDPAGNKRTLTKTVVAKLRR